MKKLILASAVMLAMTGCFEDNKDDDFSCDVSHTDKMVKIVEKYKGYSWEETSTLKLDEYGYYYEDIVTKETFPSASAAAEACAEARLEASRWHDGSHTYECSGNTVIVYDYSDDGDITERQEEYERLCRESREMYESGAYSNDF